MTSKQALGQWVFDQALDMDVREVFDGRRYKGPSALDACREQPVSDLLQCMAGHISDAAAFQCWVCQSKVPAAALCWCLEKTHAGLHCTQVALDFAWAGHYEWTSLHFQT